MMRSTWRRTGLALLCAVAALPVAAGPARADGDPLAVLYADPGVEGLGRAYPPPGGFEGPCGVGVDSKGNFYVSDYYRHNIDVFNPTSREYTTRLSGEDPLDGPCGLALGSAGELYVNNLHQDVVRYLPAVFPPVAKTSYGSRIVIDSGDSTGVAVAPGSGNVYVDDGSYVAVYEPSGAPLEAGGEPVRIGKGSLGEGYGVAVSGFPETEGYVYVPDAADRTMKVYDPAVDLDNPIATIDGDETPLGGFVSLRDAAVAVDQAGTIFVSDDLQPAYYESPEAAIYAFEPAGLYAGRLKFNVIDARPPGLAVDNSTGSTRGRIYVTSGNTAKAYVYIYAAGSASKSPGVCAPDGPCPAAAAEVAGPPSPAAPVPLGTGAAAPYAAPPELSTATAPAVAGAAPALAAPAATAAAQHRRRRAHGHRPKRCHRHQRCRPSARFSR